ncbi:putative baseplate assembly protein [Rubrivirga marina]|uniref:Putative baseplate assembly protein n=1 Tax=Rubrivirga marina TaxID=1196024 RepID=A0A271IYX6_9BACT|nr:putative baseplate assembly protein [Rubrivirga marina]PAP76014.1 putative baseplate assembly protein [Rubrivirga marina]
MSDLTFCGCCDGVERQTPLSVENRPGLSALAYRVGTHGRFKASMHAALGEQPGLAGLTTRDDADPTLALIDAWATVLDVLSFYQERIANEHYLRTAAERLSVLQLAREIGYELGPGVAAGTTLAFGLQTGPGAPETSRVPAGTQAQSLPGQDELPQTFETVEEITARAEWQAMRPRASAPVVPVRGTRGIWLEGVDLNLRAGDGLLLVGEEREDDPGSERWDFRRIKDVTLDRRRALTHVVFERGLGSYVPPVLPASDPTVYVFRQRAALFGSHAPDWRAMPDSIKRAYLGLASTTPVPVDAEPWGGQLTIGDISGIEAETFPDGPIYLDALYPEIVPDSWVVLAQPEYAEAYRVLEVAEDARTGFTLSSKTTRLELDGENLSFRFGDHVQETVVFAVSEALVRAEAPLVTPVEGATVVLSKPVTTIQEGQLVAFAGTDVDTGEAATEVATVARVNDVGGLPQLTLDAPLAHRYAREDDAGAGVVGARLNANVARATHGKTVAGEVLGSGDGSVPFQRFTLANKPLTHTASVAAGGASSTLEVRVNRVRWDEVPSLYQQPPDARVYTTRLADDGTVTVQFGDGVNGARLPTAVENVTATYRMGIGLDALVDAGQISLLMTRPFGVKDVTNPEAPTGADDPEKLADARDNAPLTVLTLDRVVSVQDVEDYARAFAGIGKAGATVLWSGERQVVHLTVAGAAGAEVVEGSDLFTSLIGSLDAARHVHAEIVVSPFAPRPFGLEAVVAVDPAALADDVLAAVEAALVAAFSFEARAFGQSVSTAEVLAAMQAVEGVVFVDLESLDGADPFANPWLVARPARWEGGAIRPAELLTVDPDRIDLTATSP